MRASIAMAVYNGEKYIEEQINSIINMMSEDDEIIISYDDSTDATWEIINNYAQNNHKIKVVKNIYSKGPNGNFENAIRNCTGKYIFLCDQDDLWLDDKINKVIGKFKESKASLVIHDGYFADQDLNITEETLFERPKISISPIKNIIKGRYWGCSMAFVNNINEYILPIPTDNFMCHDLWIGVICGFKGKIELLEEKLIKHRIHDSNVTLTKSMPLKNLILNRGSFVFHTIKRLVFKGK